MRKIANKIKLNKFSRSVALRKNKKAIVREINNELKSNDKKTNKTKLKARIFINSGGVLKTR